MVVTNKLFFLLNNLFIFNLIYYHFVLYLSEQHILRFKRITHMYVCMYVFRYMLYDKLNLNPQYHRKGKQINKINYNWQYDERGSVFPYFSCFSNLYFFNRNLLNLCCCVFVFLSFVSQALGGYEYKYFVVVLGKTLWIIIIWSNNENN